MTETPTKVAEGQESRASWIRKVPCPVISHSLSRASESLNVLTLPSNWQIQWFKGLEAGHSAWNQLPSEDNFFLSGDYFRLIDQLDLPDVDSGFAIFKHPEKGHFGLVLQVFSFNAEKQMGKLDQNEQYGSFQRMAAGIKDFIARYLHFRILTIGQLLLTGDHAIRGQAELEAVELSELIAEGAEAIAKAWPERLHGIMIKDMPLAEHPRNHAYHPLPVQPNMVLQVSDSWQSFDDYTDAMSSKYRVRARRARKKGKTLLRREMDLEEITGRQSEMFKMYLAIASQSDFNAVALPEHYFTSWKRNFPERFRIWGYFVNEELVGFSTAIYNGKELEAHFLGFDAEYNRSHQLYLNILYDLVEEAIIAGCHEMVFSRTALEIKSSVGAEAEELHCWIRARIAIANPIVPVVAKFVAPMPEWEPRHPFKDN